MYPSPGDLGNHSTQVAGIIAAEGNNIVGAAGINWRARIMYLQVIQPEDATVAVATAAIEYATCWGVDAINASWGLKDPWQFSQTLYDAIDHAGKHDILFVASAGNNNHDLDDPNNPQAPQYPASYTLPNIISVAASRCDDAFRVGPPGDGSNWGAVSVDLVAPGLLTWTPSGEFLGVWRYKKFGGTSGAAPHVTGVAGLLRAKTREIPVEMIRHHILDESNLEPYLDSAAHPTVTKGRLNAYLVLNGHDPNAPAAIQDLAGLSSTGTTISLKWTSTGGDGTSGAAKQYHVRYSSSLVLNSDNFRKGIRAGNEPIPANSSGVTEILTLTGLHQGTPYSIALRAFDDWGNGPLSNVISCTTQGPCVISFCKEGGEMLQRCTWTGGYGIGCNRCCQYSCVADETCEVPDSCPMNACNGAC